MTCVPKVPTAGSPVVESFFCTKSVSAWLVIASKCGSVLTAACLKGRTGKQRVDAVRRVDQPASVVNTADIAVRRYTCAPSSPSSVSPEGCSIANHVNGMCITQLIKQASCARALNDIINLVISLIPLRDYL
jgi:hypothetical protein